MKLSKFGRPAESLYETIERAMTTGHAVIGDAGDDDNRPFATINAAIEHANTYGIETLSVHKRSR